MRRAKTITIERDDRRSQLKTFRDCVVSEQHGVEGNGGCEKAFNCLFISWSVNLPPLTYVPTRNKAL